MKIVFEDSKEVNLSKLLEFAYSDEESSEYVDFTGGNGHILEYLKNLRDDSSVILFVDVVPDNAKTIKIYRECKKYSKESSKDIYVVPIPCIEFSVIKAILGNNRNIFKEVDNVLEYDRYRDITKITDVENYLLRVLRSTVRVYCITFVIA